MGRIRVSSLKLMSGMHEQYPTERSTGHVRETAH